MAPLIFSFGWVFSCSGQQTDETVILERNEMSSDRYLRRLSLDIRGINPTIAELESFDPQNPSVMIEQFFEHEGFENRILAMYAEVYGTVTDSYFLSGSDFQYDDEIAFRKAIGEEPLRLLAYVATNDLPWYSIVTAEHTMANPTLAAIFPVDYPVDGSDWQPVSYTDGRPMAGVLSTNSMWLRYTSTNTNANRLRANEVSRILLCNNFLEKPISFDRDSNVLDLEGIENAIKTDPNCIYCHQTLDPLAAHFFGFWAYQNESWMESSWYHPDRERLWDDYLDVAPEYFGQTSDGLSSLGWLIASDPRFPNCAVEQMTGFLLQQELELSDADRLYQHREVFLSSNLNLKQLIASIVQSPEYRAGRLDTSIDSANAKLLKVDQLVSSIEELTGFSWKFGDFDMFDNDIVGLRSLAGGVDGRAASSSARVPNTTMILVHKVLAEQSAVYVYLEEKEQPKESRRFFTLVDFEAPLQEVEAREQIAYFHRLILSADVSLDGPEVEAGLDLWEAVNAVTSNPAEAWIAVLTVVLRDPNYLIY
jgi:hypothetical protein